MAKKVYRNKNKRNAYTFRSGTIPAGGVGAVEESEVSLKLIEQGILVELNADEAALAANEAENDATSKDSVEKAKNKTGKKKKKPAEAEEPPAPVEETKPDEEDTPKGDDDPWTNEEAAQKLFAEPELLEEGDFLQSGKPDVKALEAVFEQKFKAADRDEIWSKVEQLKKGE